MFVQFKKIALFAVSFIALSTAHSASTYPIRYQKLAKLLPNGTVSIIDFISDAHIPLQENPQESEQHLLLNENEKNAFTACERELLSTLRELKDDNKPIDLLWEANDNLTNHPSVEQQIQPLFHDKNLMSQHKELESEFSDQQESKVKFVQSDNYRNQIYLSLLFPQANSKIDSIIDKKIKSTHAMKCLTSLLFNKTSLASKDLENSKKLHDAETYNRLENLWECFKKKKLLPFYNQHLHQSIQTHKRAFDFYKNIPSNISTLDILDICLISIADYNFLLKIFSTPHNRKIMYAGAMHCINVIKILKEQFGYTEVINCGVPLNTSSLDFFTIYNLTPMYPSVWKYLKESEQTTKNRLEHNNTISKTLSKKSLSFLFEDNKKPQFFNKKIKQYIDNHYNANTTISASDQDYLITNAVKNDAFDAVKYILKKHQSNAKKLAESALKTAVTNKKHQITQYLLQSSLIDNLNNIILPVNGWTLLHKAYESDDKITQKILIEHGADQYKKDIHGKIPSDYKPLWRTVEKAKNKIADSVAYIGNWALQYKLAKALSDTVQYGQGNAVTR